MVFGGLEMFFPQAEGILGSTSIVAGDKRDESTAESLAGVDFFVFGAHSPKHLEP